MYSLMCIINLRNNASPPLYSFVLPRILYTVQCAISLRRRVIIGVPRVLFSSRIFHVQILAQNRKEHYFFFFFTNYVTCVTDIQCLIKKKKNPFYVKSHCCRLILLFFNNEILAQYMTCFRFALSTVIYVQSPLMNFLRLVYALHTLRILYITRGVILRGWKTNSRCPFLL